MTTRAKETKRREDGGEKNKVLIMMDDAVFHLQEQDVCAGAWC